MSERYPDLIDGLLPTTTEPQAYDATPCAPDEHDGERKSRVRARTISIKRLSKREIERGRMLYPETEYDRPTTRADCLHGPHAERPCPFTLCKHHLALDVNELTGSIKFNFPDLEVWEMPETCALDIADRGGITLEEVGEIMNLTRERIRQLETRGLAKLKALSAMGTLSDYTADDFDVWQAARAVMSAPHSLRHLYILGAMDEMRAAWTRLGLVSEGDGRNVAVRSTEVTDGVVKLTCSVLRDGTWRVVWRMDDSDRVEAVEALATWWSRQGVIP